ncbi:hypothetical protein K469DRAFT_702446 [Zopfia rhizophila CBS 207.26]|uniref:Uncharacterized protein n=1 Tax=Zopfia rhizophila CBS 207.26 TaxID=1314779 RepID=A0A6A6EAA8_9PEZI|nr:hypothetical protein K469DRAFT_702446 [Zopfia rhizophila CBS 207.26]
MIDLKDQMIEEAQEQRERTEDVLDDIESFGERFKCPYENCAEPYCTKQCFAQQHFGWCLEHSAPSSEDVHGTYRITEVLVTRVNGQIIERCDIVEKLKCALAGQQEGGDPDCNVVQSDFMGPDDLHEFEMDRWMAEQMGKDSP